ncbi:coiled-coil domain-containing protein 148-like [Eucyclogobius newberryi]|uniref:coiled-coil domain-containing protein 148-like n=1 Tax=Eucyclogobius newberryi TaxID=166745 RepID=UPI003B58C1B2
MSETDPRTFTTKLNADDVERLTIRMKNGFSSSHMYRPAEYERLQAIMEAKRQDVNLIGQKVERSLCAAKVTKERSILRQHRQVWSSECPRLQKAEKNIQDDIQDFFQQIKPRDRTDTAIFSLLEYELCLEREREGFRRATVEPVLQLRDDVHYRLREVLNQPLSPDVSNRDQVIQQINFVKEQQAYIIKKLQDEYRYVEAEITAQGLEDMVSGSADAGMMEDVPWVVEDADCPYPELKSSLIEAFQSLSERYKGRLEGLQEKLHQTDRFCGWCEEDHLQFTSIVSQYNQDVPNYRSLCTDMLQRVFPDRTKQDLMEHKRKCSWQHFTQSQRRAVTLQWHRDQEELLAQALVTLQEAKHGHQEALDIHKGRQQQQDICAQLHTKLQQWRAQQEEVARLEAAIATRQREAEEQRLKREKEKQAVIRTQQKEQVKEFYLKQQRQREEVERRDQERLASLRALIEEQAGRDKDRVQFRAEMVQRRREERGEQEAERQKEEEEKQKRLEALRNQVAVVAEADPERVMADTEAWRSRHVNMEDFELQRPLYSINTYTDTQIVSDARVRIEQALRQAGLHNTMYARQVLSTVPPPRPPRRDTESNIKL